MSHCSHPAMNGRYDGPIIDAHHHLWDLSLGRHPWLTSAAGAIKALGNIDFLRRDYLIADYLADVGPQNVVGSVYVEAVWDRARPPTEEIAWVEGLARPAGIAARTVAWAPLAAPDVAATLDALAAHRSVAGIRETVRWHPDPAKRWTPAGLMDDPAWRRGAALLAHRGLTLDLLMNPHQAEDVVRLARDLPELTIIVNHCGTPTERDDAGLRHWRDGLHAMGRLPNVAIKLSNYAAYAADRSLPALRATVMTCIDAFGMQRALFGTDYPVGGRTLSFQEHCNHFMDVVATCSADEQRALFHDNAARLYRFPTSG